jgi:antitoxin ParD1/3/4
MAIRASMNVSVTPELEEFVQDLVSSGRYHSASEVFRDGLRLLEQAERQRLLEKWLAQGLTADEEKKLPPDVLAKARSRIKAMIQEGVDEARRGEFVEGDAFMATWKKRLEDAATSRPRKSRVKRRR